MSQLESKDERDFTEIARAAGWWSDKIMRTSRNSFPDRVYLKAGRWVLIEWKSNDGPISELQKVRHAELRRFGAEVHVCRNIREAKRALGIA